MNCRRCGKENDPDNQFCGRCGIEMATVQEQQLAAEGRPCYRHPRELTLLACGRCDQPICTRCVVMSPAGPRCPDCARPNVKVSARGVAHDMTSGMRRLVRASPIVAILIAVILFGMFRGCACYGPPPPYYEEEEVLPPPSPQQAMFYPSLGRDHD